MGVSKYFDAAKIRILDIWAQPIEAVGAYLSLPFAMLIYILIWGVFFSNQNKIGGFSYAEMLIYLFLTLLFRGLGDKLSEVNHVEDEIRKGKILIYLTRPIDYFFFCLGNRIGSVFVMSIITIPLLLGSYLYVFGGLPILFPHLLLALLLVYLGVLVLFEVYYIVNLLAFWFEEVWGFRRGIITVSWLFSGGVVPISLMPETLQTIAKILPFHHAAGIPSLFLLGKESLSTYFESFLILGGWAILLFFAQKYLWKKGLKKYDGKGL